MEQRRTTPRARHQTRVFYGDQGLDVAEKIRASGVGRKMFLTTPFIDQAFTPTTRIAICEIASVSQDRVSAAGSLSLRRLSGDLGLY
jgi:hypothetical protein